MRRTIIEIADDISDEEGFECVLKTILKGKISSDSDGVKYCNATIYKINDFTQTVVYCPPRYKACSDKFVVYSERINIHEPTS